MGRLPGPPAIRELLVASRSEMSIGARTVRPFALLVSLRAWSRAASLAASGGCSLGLSCRNCASPAAFAVGLSGSMDCEPAVLDLGTAGQKARIQGAGMRDGMAGRRGIRL